MKKKNLFQVIYHHRHGVDTVLIEAEEQPQDSMIENYLIEHNSFEPDNDDEYFEVKLAEVIHL